MFVSVGAEGQLSERQSHGEDHEAAARKTAGPTGPTQTVQLAGYETVRCSLCLSCVALQLLWFLSICLCGCRGILGVCLVVVNNELNRPYLETRYPIDKFRRCVFSQ